MNKIERLTKEIEARLNDFDSGIFTKEETIDSFIDFILEISRNVAIGELNRFMIYWGNDVESEAYIAVNSRMTELKGASIKEIRENQRQEKTMEKTLFEYSSNNSGGSWWLKDEDWYNLEKAGWLVDWNREFVYVKGNYKRDKNGLPTFKTKKSELADEDGRWLGSLAKYAFKHFNTVKECLEEFEKITGQNVSDEGCNCCGAPHSFFWDGGYCSGKDCLEYLYDNSPKNLREACELLKTKQVGQ